MSHPASSSPGWAGKVAGTVRRLGLLNGCLFGLSRLLKKARCGSLHRYHLCAQPIRNQPGPRTGRGAIQVMEVAEADYGLDWFPRPGAVIKDRYRQGATCLVAFQAGKPIGFLWLVRNAYLEDEVRCRYILSPAESTVWDFDVFLHPEYRFGRGFVRLWAAADALMLEEGRRWTLSRIDAFNRNSLQAHKSRGAHVVGDLLFLRIGAVQLMLGNRAPYCHLSLTANHIPRVTVTPGNVDPH